MAAVAEPRQARRRAVLPVAAVLLAAASVLDPLSRNVHQASLTDALPALLIATGLAVAAWLAAAAVRGRADAGAALIACVWVVGSFYYLELVRHLNAALGGDYSQVRPLPIVLAVMLLLTFVLRGRGGWQAVANSVLTAVAVVMLAFPVWRMAAFEWRNGPARQAYDVDRAMAAMPELAGVAADDGAARPDIYHLVFDRYGSEETVTRHYGVQEPVGAFLESQGLYVARDSFSNYLSTGHSVASTFHMDYLGGLAADERVKGNNWHPIFEMLDDNRVGRFLRGLGYRQHQFGSWWVGSYHNPNAASNQPMGLSEFNMTYFRRTIVMPVMHLLPDAPWTMQLNWDNGQCQRVARQIEAIKALPRGEAPVYVFAHILVPHGPYVFDADGSCIGQKESEARGEPLGYAAQVAYADRIIEDLVTSLIAEGRPEPVILIQADEGPIPPKDAKVQWQDATDEQLRIKFGILAAYYLPGRDYSRLRQDISPVNSYRVILGEVFGVELPDLPDRMLAFPDHWSIYQFHDVTERVRCAAPAEPGQVPLC